MKPTQLGLHFSDFLRFSMEFPRISKTHVLLEIPFCNPAPESFRFLTSRSLLCTQDPGKNRGDAIGSPRAAGGGPAKIPASSDGGAGRESRGEGLRVARGRFGSDLEAGAAPARGLDGTR
jgi:hypothetical protein